LSQKVQAIRETGKEAGSYNVVAELKKWWHGTSATAMRRFQ
jgi:hypothetical protein